jgi:hypothetical protein
MKRKPMTDGDDYAVSAEIDATEWLATLQLNTKMSNSLVARKMRITPKHVEDIMGGSPTLFDIAKMFYALGYKMHIYTENIETGEKEMQPPQLLPHALKHPHIRAQLEKQRAQK